MSAGVDPVETRLNRQQLVERILFAVDGYRFGEWSLAEAAARITREIQENPEAA